MPSFFESSFFTAFFGAISGALTAAWLASSERKRQLLRDEILACNIAIGQSVAITNVFLALKRQRVQPMRIQYENICGAMFYTSILSSLRKPITYGFSFDFRKMYPPWSGVESLNSTIGNHIRSGSRPAQLLAQVNLFVRNQERAVIQRNEEIDRISELEYIKIVPLYFGLELARGTTDTSYPNTVQQIVVYTDDCLYFSNLLTDVLIQHGSILAERLGKSAPTVDKTVLGEEYVPFMPDPKNYSQFESAFRPKRAG